jgi:tetratricopeptide (TPR) repeat protein
MAGRFANLEFDEEPRDETEQSASAISPTDRDGWALLERARQAHIEGQYEVALRLYTRALQDDRRLIRAWVGQVQMLVNLGELHEASVWSDKALQLFKNNGELLAAKAQACIRLRDPKSALACSDGAMQAPGASAWRWEVRGEVLLARRDAHFDICFQKALAEPDADWFDRVVIARIYRYYQRAAVAMQYLQSALDLSPQAAYAWYELGDCQRELGLLNAASASFEHCLDLRPDCREAADALQKLSHVSFIEWLGSVFRRWRLR